MLTQEDKQLIAEYMGWGELTETIRIIGSFDAVATRPFDLNDTGLVVQEMQKRGDISDFANNGNAIVIPPALVSGQDSIFLRIDLFNADNFFAAFVEWRRPHEDKSD